MYAGHGPLRACASMIESDLRTCRSARKGGGLHEQGGLLRAYQRAHRTEALDAVVPEDGGAWRKPALEPVMEDEITSRSGQIQEYLPSLDGEHQGLVHHRASCGGGSASRPTTCHKGGLRGGRDCPKRRWSWPSEKTGDADADRPPTCGRIKDVLDTWFSSLAVADFGVRRHQPPRQRGDSVTTTRRQRPGNGLRTSSSSGWRA